MIIGVLNQVQLTMEQPGLISLVPECGTGIVILDIWHCPLLLNAIIQTQLFSLENCWSMEKKARCQPTGSSWAWMLRKEIPDPCNRIHLPPNEIAHSSNQQSSLSAQRQPTSSLDLSPLFKEILESGKLYYARTKAEITQEIDSGPCPASWQPNKHVLSNMLVESKDTVIRI